MLLGFAELLILGFVIEWVCRRCSLPGLVGMLALGLLVGVSGFNCVSSKVLSSSSDLTALSTRDHLTARWITSRAQGITSDWISVADVGYTSGFV